MVGRAVDAEEEILALLAVVVVGELEGVVRVAVDEAVELVVRVALEDGRERLR